MDSINEIQKSVDHLSRGVQEGKGHAQDLIAHVAGIEQRVEKLSKNAVAQAVVIRNAFARMWNLLKSCLENTNTLCHIAEEIGKAIDDALGKGLIDKVKALIECLVQCFSSIPLFVNIVENLKSTQDAMKNVCQTTHTFMTKVEQVTHGAVDTIKHDLTLIERDIDSTLALCMFSLRRGAVALTSHPCLNVVQAADSVPTSGSCTTKSLGMEWAGALKGLHGECLELLKAFEGKAGSEEFVDLKTKIEVFQVTLQGMHDRFENKLHDLEKPPQGFWETVASPFVKTYQACDFGVEVAEDVIKIPGLWGDAKAMMNNGKDLLEETHKRMSNFWDSLHAMVKQLCADLWVVYNEEFGDASITDVYFDPSVGFLCYYGHWILASSCFKGPWRLVQQAVDGAIRNKKRAFGRKCWKVVEDSVKVSDKKSQ